MPLLFVYGSLKQGFANQQVNRGRRLPGAWRTRVPMALVLLGGGRVPCLLLDVDAPAQVVGEVYEVDAEGLAAMDRLERLGEPDGYERVTLGCERFDCAPPQPLEVFAYGKRAAHVPAQEPRVGPLAEYTHEHARGFRW